MNLFSPFTLLSALDVYIKVQLWLEYKLQLVIKDMVCDVFYVEFNMYQYNELHVNTRLIPLLHSVALFPLNSYDFLK